ncbi:hypothetical protein LCGC14_0902240 [marine sediment metagenome]|uniref:Methyltransferase type 11 domain-containing protein n=1 Tax=marine sediment metagenome TaxID=412755 RepID=A0A0F9P0W1_9ZZZZ
MKKIGLPNWVLDLAYKFVDVEKNSPTVDERTYEYAFAASKLLGLPVGTKLLDVGCVARTNFIPALACELDFDVWGIDIRPYWFEHPNFTFIQGDITDPRLVPHNMDIVTAISTIEHIGIKGRYGVTKKRLGSDWTAIRSIYGILRQGGSLVLTVPTHLRHEDKISSLGKTYGTRTINSMLRGWKEVDCRVFKGLYMTEWVK